MAQTQSDRAGSAAIPWSGGLFTDPALGEHLAMRGGMVLHKAYLAPASRYSEDIDLVLVKAMDVETLDHHLRRVLTPVLGQPADSLIADAWLAIRNVLRPSKILRTAYRFVPVGLRRKAAFRRDMDTLLRPGLPRFDVDQGAEIVREAYFKYLKP